MRTTDGKCCDWCTKIAGRYDYATAPDDIFRRHDNCGCTTIYENGRQRQDVWTKKSWEVPEIEDKEYKPTVFNAEQAKALKKKNMQYKGLTDSKESGIINEKSTKNITYRKGVSDFEESVQKQIRRSERILTNNNFETALVYNSEGKCVLKKKGSQHEVVFTKKELKMMKNCVVTHNHPSGSCFSPADISVFLENEIAEMRVCTRRKHYSVKAPDKWKTKLTTYSDINKRYTELDTIFSEKYAKIASQKGESVLLYDDLIQEDIYKELSKEMGFEFSIEYADEFQQKGLI